MDDLDTWLRLARTPGMHGGVLAGLPAELRSAPALCRARPAALAAAGLSANVVAGLRRADAAAGVESDRQWLQGPNRVALCWGEPAYPPLLASIPDPPILLFVEGDPNCLSLPQLAMVGSRNPTALGRDTAQSFAAHLARAGLAITSGLALGIDAASHRGALDASGSTIAVLGGGLDEIYPRENEALARRILVRGALVSEFPIGTPPLKGHFPRRNRIIAGLSVGTLVVEAALQSGSLITARLAGEYGREVFAIPGSIHNPTARGCHRLIRQGAKLVETADDIFTELAALLHGLRLDSTPEAPDAQGISGPVLDKDYEILLDALGFEPASVDALVTRSGLKPDAVASMLLILELDGQVQQQPGGFFGRRLPGKGK